MGKTYDPIASTTLGSAAASFTFSSISSGYTDLILEFTYPSSGTSGQQIGLRFNSDTGSNYSHTVLYGESSAGSARGTNLTYARTGHAQGTGYFEMHCYIQSYANTSMIKSILARNNVPGAGVYGTAAEWRSTSAITSVTVMIDGGTLPAGAIIALYGVKSA